MNQDQKIKKARWATKNHPPIVHKSVRETFEDSSASTKAVVMSPFEDIPGAGPTTAAEIMMKIGFLLLELEEKEQVDINEVFGVEKWVK